MQVIFWHHNISDVTSTLLYISVINKLRLQALTSQTSMSVSSCLKFGWQHLSAPFSAKIDNMGCHNGRSWSDWPWFKLAVRHLRIVDSSYCSTAPDCAADMFMFTRFPEKIAIHNLHSLHPEFWFCIHRTQTDENESPESVTVTVQKEYLDWMNFAVLWWVVTSSKVHYFHLWQRKNEKGLKWLKSCSVTTI